MYKKMYLPILKEIFIFWGIQGIMCINIYIEIYIIFVSFNITRGFYYLGGIMYIYVSFNIKRGFYYLGDLCSKVLNKINIVYAAGL